VHHLRGSRLARVLLPLALLCLATGAAFGQAPDVSGTILLDPHVNWRPSSGLKNDTLAYTLERTEEGLRVELLEPGHGIMLNMPNYLRLDPEQTPILAMKYRATGLNLMNPNQGFLVFWGGKPYNLAAVFNSDLVSDGEIHEVWLDLREGLAGKEVSGEAMVSIDLRIRAADQGPSVFTLLDLRFEPDGPVVPSEEAREQAAPVKVHVTDQDGKPIADALVTLDAHTRNLRVTAKTDKEGYATVAPAFPGLAGTRQSVLVTKEGMAGILFVDLKDVGPETELTAKLRPTRTLSGRVVDEDGKPVAGATGEIWEHGGPRSREPGRPRVVWDKHVVSDAEGRWSCPSAPDLSGKSVQVRWATVGYVDDRWGGHYSGQLTMTDLLSGKAVSTLHRGTDLSGVVTNEAGEPVPGAKVAQGEDRFPSNAPPATVTDADGRFEFDGVAPEKLVLTVTAKGYAPELFEAAEPAGLPPVQIVLKPPHTFRFRVVDTQGNPVPSISFSPDTWRGYRTIPQRFRSNAEGLATWQGPEDDVKFDLFARNWTRQEVTTGPSTGEDDVVEVVMHGPLSVTIHATDAETGQPLKQFTVVKGLIWRKGGEQPPAWQPSMPTPPGQNGEWKQTFTDNYPFLVFRIEAEGYAPIDSKPVAKDAGDVELALKLTKAEPVRVTLVDEKEQPVGGATAYLAIGRNMVQIRNGAVEYGRDCATYRADEQGRFSFPPQIEDFLLVIPDRRGYAQIDAEGLKAAKGKVTLKRWGTVAGTLLVGNTAKAGEQVTAYVREQYKPRKPRAYHMLRGTTQDDGSFRIESVPPGKITVGRSVRMGNQSIGHTLSKSLEIQPGQTVTVNLGGSGRPVAGRFVWPKDAEAVPFGIGHQSFASTPNQDAMKELQEKYIPKDFGTWDVDRRKAWMESKEGKEAQEKLRAASLKANAHQRRYNFAVAEDGSFRIENVEPGTYSLNLAVYDKPEGRRYGYGKHRGSVNTNVVVPPLPEGVTYLDEPLELGELTVMPIKPAPQAGQPAPDFTVPVPDLTAKDIETAGKNAKELSLHDLRGKVVLLDFWATWCGSCVAEMPRMKKIWEAYGTDERFAMVGLSLDRDPQALLDYVKKTKLGWPQAYLNATKNTDGTAGYSLKSLAAFSSMKLAGVVMGGYGVRSIPSVCLVGPDGKILAMNLQGRAVETAVAKALADQEK
jgi:protocatechuate 3,4-dioxygenase beta subunit/thiol-disulfide isomerase/thioredoxin